MYYNHLKKYNCDVILFLFIKTLEASTGGIITVIKNFAKLTGKQPRWNLFLVKLQTSRPARFLKRDSKTGVFS